MKDPIFCHVRVDTQGSDTHYIIRDENGVEWIRDTAGYFNPIVPMFCVSLIDEHLDLDDEEITLYNNVVRGIREHDARSDHFQAPA